MTLRLAQAPCPEVGRAWAGRGRPLARSRIGFPEALAKVVPPALGKRGKLACLAQKILVRGVRRIQADDLGDADRKLVPGDRSDGIAGRNFALAGHGEIKAGPAAPRSTWRSHCGSLPRFSRQS